MGFPRFPLTVEINVFLTQAVRIKIDHCQALRVGEWRMGVLKAPGSPYFGEGDGERLIGEDEQFPWAVVENQATLGAGASP